MFVVCLFCSEGEVIESASQSPDNVNRLLRAQVVDLVSGAVVSHIVHVIFRKKEEKKRKKKKKEKERKRRNKSVSQPASRWKQEPEQERKKTKKNNNVCPPCSMARKQGTPESMKGTWSDPK